MTIVEQLKRDEGRRPKAYQDTRGVWTVGYGHNLMTDVLSEDAMTQILEDDLQAVETSCLSLPVWQSLSDARRGVLLNMAYNLGFDGLLEFRSMLAALARSDWAGAARSMLDSRWATEVGARANRLAEQMETDTWV